jgi:hypothetical protein
VIDEARDSVEYLAAAAVQRLANYQVDVLIDDLVLLISLEMLIVEQPLGHLLGEEQTLRSPSLAAVLHILPMPPIAQLHVGSHLLRGLRHAARREQRQRSNHVKMIAIGLEPQEIVPQRLGGPRLPDDIILADHAPVARWLTE